MKNLIKKYLPRPMLVVLIWLKTRTHLFSAYIYDLKKFEKYSSTRSPFLSRQNLAARLTENYHNIEKGLSLPNPRPLFGQTKIQTLLSNLDYYQAKFGEDQYTDAAKGAMKAYVDFNLSVEIKESEIPQFSKILSTVSGNRAMNGGTMSVSSQEISEAVKSVNLDFFLTRHSVRRFQDGPVQTEAIEFATAAALKSPAVCNRQFTNIYVTQSSDVISEALKIQNGARGFAEQVPALAVITTPISSYWGAEERHQAWSDGGMFAMSFILGLHAQGLGAVCLNWSKLPAVDRIFHKTFSIPENETVIMLIGFGNLMEKFLVARSPRGEIDTSLKPLELL